MGHARDSNAAAGDDEDDDDMQVARVLVFTAGGLCCGLSEGWFVLVTGDIVDMLLIYSDDDDDDDAKLEAEALEVASAAAGCLSCC